MDLKDKIMANIDERLLAGSKADEGRQKQMGYSDRLRQEKMGAADRERQAGGEPSSAEATEDKSGSLRQRVQAARRAMDIKQRAKDKLEAKVAAPARAATSKLLQQAWINLIDSFGLTLIYINIHVFLRFVLGEKLFCKLGQEWVPKQISSVSGAPGEMAGKTIGIAEVMALLILDLIAFFIILGALGLIAMIVSWATNPLSAVKAIYDLGWSGVSVLVNLFEGLLKGL